MNNNNQEQQFIKTDNNIIINEKYIRWVKKISDCLEVCTRSKGCDIQHYSNTHRICKSNSPESYNKLNQHFE